MNIESVKLLFNELINIAIRVYPMYNENVCGFLMKKLICNNSLVFNRIKGDRTRGLNQLSLDGYRLKLIWTLTPEGMFKCAVIDLTGKYSLFVREANSLIRGVEMFIDDTVPIDGLLE